MAKRSAIDKAVRNIMIWADRPEWSAQRTLVFDAHLDPVCERLGISGEELAEELGQHDYAGMLFGVLFEDFLSRRVGPDHSNIIDDYLKRRGWREGVPGRRYLHGLRDSVLSLYEVTAVSPGRHCDLRDLMRDGETIRVHEHMGTQALVRWDQIAARVLFVNGRHIFSGGILPFPREAARRLLDVLSESRKKFDRELAKSAGKKLAAEIASSTDLDELFLRRACPAFTSVWLAHTLERLHQPLPELTNREGHAFVFTETRFPCLAEQLDEIASRLDGASDWERDAADVPTWTWLSGPGDMSDPETSALAIDTLQGGEKPIYGTLELTPGALTLTTNSVERAERGKNELAALLDQLIGPPSSTLQTPEQLMAETDAAGSARDEARLEESIDPELAAEVTQHMLDQHYRRVLDEPIPALDDKTPRECASSKKARQKVIDWLKHLENSELHRAANQGQEPYDSSWIWDELKLTEHRD
jgi:hypothetical protein